MARIVLALIVALMTTAWLPAYAQQQEKRLALVIGNGSYEAGALQTAANDAGLVAQTLQAAGFDVVGARDLDGETLRKSFRDFVQKVQEAGPDTVAFVYLAGYGVQLTGENYFVPVDAKIVRDTDIPVEALRLSDYMRQLAALPVKANVIVLDAARAAPFAKQGQPLAGGLALVEPDPKMLIAFNAAPGTVAPEGQPPYGPYAQALAEMIRAGGLSLPEVFDRVRLRVNEMTKGGQIPWNAQKIDTQFVFLERNPDAPPIQVDAGLRTKPIQEFGAQDAYAAALERDTLQGYEEYLQAYPSDPMAARVRAIVAARREAITWRRTYRTDTPAAYWSYLKRYPRGPHAADARRRLAILASALEPPPSFSPIMYDDVPPPPPEEIVYFEDQAAFYFDDPMYGFAPPPPAPVFFLPPPPPDFVVLEPPPPPIDVFYLPTPIFVAIPVYVHCPPYVAPPPNNIVYANIHSRAVINDIIVNRNRPLLNATGPQPGGQRLLQSVAPALPRAAALRAALVRPAPTGAPGSPSGVTPNGLTSRINAGPAANGNILPGANGQPLPAAGARLLGGGTGRLSPQTATAPADGTQPSAGTGPAVNRLLNGRQTPGAGTPPTGGRLGLISPGSSVLKPADGPKDAGAPSSINRARAALAKPTTPVPPSPVRIPPSMRGPSQAAISPPLQPRRLSEPPLSRLGAPPSLRVNTPPPRVSALPPPRINSAPPPMRMSAPPAPRMMSAPSPTMSAPPPMRMAAPPIPRMAAPMPRIAAPPPSRGGGLLAR